MRRRLNLLTNDYDYRSMIDPVPPKTHPSDAISRRYEELLVTLAQAGDRIAYERLATRWHPRLARTARRLLGDEGQALEAAQESWIAIQRGLGSLRDPSRFAPWAFAILRRRCADRIRRLQVQRNRESELDDAIAEHGVTDDTLTIQQAFATLPPDQQLAAQLFFVEGLTLDEIAETQGVPLGTVKSRLFHTRQKLKAALSGDVP